MPPLLIVRLSPINAKCYLDAVYSSTFLSFFFFLYEKKKNLHASVWYVALTNQIAALGYVSRTNQIAALGYVSCTNHIMAFDYLAPIPTIGSCFLVNDVMDNGSVHKE